MKAPQLIEHPQVRGKNVQRKIRTRLDLLSIPQSVGKNVKTFRWDQRLLLNSIQYLLFRTIQGKETNFRVYKLIQNKLQCRNKQTKDPYVVPGSRFLKITSSDKISRPEYKKEVQPMIAPAHQTRRLYFVPKMPQRVEND